MNAMTAILIDDESRSKMALRQKLIDNCPDITIIAECENGEEGLVAINQLKPDIVFLDVEMPRMNGFVMLQQLGNRNFEVIFTTAYDHYAIQAIRFSALDYLVKPIQIELLKEAVERVRLRKKQDVPDQRMEVLLHNLLNEKNQQSRLGLPSREGLIFVEIQDIIYLEAEGNYTKFCMQPARTILISITLKDFEELLPATTFIRIHHSFMVNKNHVHKYLRGEGGQVVMVNGKTIDISRRRKEEFFKAIGHG